jgi:AAA domain
MARVTAMPEALALRPEELRRRVDPAALPFRTTAEVEQLTGTIGQPRALAAIDFGLGIGAPGYNLFTGQRTRREPFPRARCTGSSRNGYTVTPTACASSARPRTVKRLARASV